MKKTLLLPLLAIAVPGFASDVYQQDGYFGVQYNMLNQEKKNIIQ